ncbi:hypothetical protein KXD93_23965 [Mucilaginibacter sp. BJC16-A38]|nr:hypothetical protein [Mucilaginibacter phenanthrenivorans]MCR8560734.1 hypothetical protein [Mucilaginibacter phenanthrenivorans]
MSLKLPLREELSAFSNCSSLAGKDSPELGETFSGVLQLSADNAVFTPGH